MTKALAHAAPLFCILLVLTSGAAAEPSVNGSKVASATAAQPSRDPARVQRDMDRLFNVVDINHDGVISREEAHLAFERFRAMRTSQRDRIIKRATHADWSRP